MISRRRQAVTRHIRKRFAWRDWRVKTTLRNDIEVRAVVGRHIDRFWRPRHAPTKKDACVTPRRGKKALLWRGRGPQLQVRWQVTQRICGHRRHDCLGFIFYHAHCATFRINLLPSLGVGLHAIHAEATQAGPSQRIELRCEVVREKRVSAAAAAAITS